MWIFEHEQESIAERGAGCLSASEEEREGSNDEVPLVEFCVGIRFLLHPGNKVWVGGPGAS